MSEWRKEIAVVRFFDGGAAFHFSGRTFGLNGQTGGFAVLSECGQFLPPIEPVSGLGFCQGSAFDYPDRMTEFETVWREDGETLEFVDITGLKITLDKATGQWRA